MFAMRTDAKTRGRSATQARGAVVRRAADAPPIDARPRPEHTPIEDGALTLATRCACGHARRDHRGLRMEVAGPCLECGCEEFRRAPDSPESDEQVMRRVRAGIERVERLQQMVAQLRARSNDEPSCDSKLG
jgi:hypothetical protein